MLLQVSVSADCVELKDVASDDEEITLPHHSQECAELINGGLSDDTFSDVDDTSSSSSDSETQELEPTMVSGVSYSIIQYTVCN